MNSFWNGRSIAFRLVVAVLAVEALFALLIVFLAFGYERHVQFDAFHTMVHGRADSVIGAIQDSEDAADTLIMSRQDLHLPAEDVWEALDADGRVLGQSDNWNGAILENGKVGHDGFLRATLDRRGYAVLVLQGTRLVDPGRAGRGHAASAGGVLRRSHGAGVACHPRRGASSMHRAACCCCW